MQTKPPIPHALSSSASDRPIPRAAVVIDVRSGVEYRRGHIPGAAHLPFWLALFRRLPIPSQATPVVLYCGHGPRAWLARWALRARGVADVDLLAGHFARWRREGRKIDVP